MFRKLHEPNGDRLSIEIDGVPVEAEPGETVAAVLLRQEEDWCRLTPVSGSPRSPYCMMGVCFECLAVVDGAPSVQTCLRTVENGMRVDRQRGRPRIGS